MKNEYIVSGETVVLLLPRRTGEPLEALFSLADLDVVNGFRNTWCATWKESSKSFYVYGMARSKGLTEQVYLHRLIMSAPPGLVVDHRNHNGLDNRRDNLVLVTKQVNLQNRRGAPSNNKSSGIRGVSYCKQTGKWRAYVHVPEANGKSKRLHLGRFDTVDEAATVAAHARLLAQPGATN